MYVRFLHRFPDFPFVVLVSQSTKTMKNTFCTRRELMHFLGAGTLGSFLSPAIAQAMPEDGCKPIYVSKEKGEKIPIGAMQ